MATSRGKANPLAIIFLTQGLWATVMFRISHCIEEEMSLPIIRPLLRGCTAVGQKLIEILTGICLPAECHIGEGLYVGHYGPLIVSGKAHIGKNCNLSQGNTIGAVQSGDRQGAPTIGDRVYLGPGAIIIGNISVGDDAAVGAGAVVVHDVPARGVVAGNPARLISCNGSFDYVRYDHMEEDQDRAQSLRMTEIGACDATPDSHA